VVQAAQFLRAKGPTHTSLGRSEA